MSAAAPAMIAAIAPQKPTWTPLTALFDVPGVSMLDLDGVDVASPLLLPVAGEAVLELDEGMSKHSLIPGIAARALRLSIELLNGGLQWSARM